MAMIHFLIKFLEANVSSCPFCKREGKYSELRWDLHPKDSKTLSVEDRAFGNCDNGHDIYCALQPYVWFLGTDPSDTGEKVDPWGRLENDPKEEKKEMPKCEPPSEVELKDRMDELRKYYLG